MKITIVLPNLAGGGAERLHVYLANEWVSKGYVVEFVLMSKQGELLPLLVTSILVFDLNVQRIRDVVLPLAVHLQKSRPQVVLVAMWPLTSAATISWILSGLVGKLFLSDHENLTLSYIEQGRVRPIYLRYLIRLTYRFATGIVAVSRGVMEDLRSLGGLSAGKIHVIYNPAAIGISPICETPEVQKMLWGDGYDCHILSVGRLALQKDHATLIKAFSMLPSEINAKLVILGEGPLRAELTALITQLGIESRVSMLGFMNDPSPWFRSADLFVLSSRWEGFGNVIVEALECGVPVVSTNCPSGPSEILEDGRYGSLVPVQNPVALSNAMVQSLRATHDKEGLMLRAQDFSVSKISEEYLKYMFSDDRLNARFL